ncbi:DNA methyltransferase [uncultured Lutibacter sp.]|uniref:DNA methyltransferase n=1 Tax=uncultured Lutibacter sp. TaxID=437739 RepID=UPI002636318F|nr:DNA methyltransferase [uncultured Lutibacter sp.]
MIQITNEDNMELMARYEDNYFDLAIVDPPYGIGMDGKNNWSGSKHEVKDWDNEAPSVEYFNELFRISKNQIVWGANHFISRMPFDSSCWLIWDKKNDGFSFADAEMAWTSFDTAIRFFRYHRGQQTDKRIHPTQKPKELYRFILDKYAKPNDKIFDSHLGSGSIALACEDLGFDLVGTEIDKDYFEKAVKRYNVFKQQLKLF